MPRVSHKCSAEYVTIAGYDISRTSDMYRSQGIILPADADDGDSREDGDDEHRPRHPPHVVAFCAIHRPGFSLT